MDRGIKWNSGPIGGSRNGGLKWSNRSDDDDKSGGDRLRKTGDTVSEDEAAYRLSEGIENSLSIGKDAMKSPVSSHRREGSACSGDHSDNSMEDAADGAISDWANEAGGSTSNKSHAYQESISSDEGLQVDGISRRTFKSNRLRKSNVEGVKEGGISTPGSADARYSWSRSGELDRSSASIWTEREDISSDFTSSSGGMGRYRGVLHTSGPSASNFAGLDIDMSKRMDELRDQRFKSQFQATGGMRRSVRGYPEPSRLAAPDNRGYQTEHCCLHCISDVCQAFRQIQPPCCDNGSCRSCSHCCCYPSAALGRRCHADPSTLPRRSVRLRDTGAETPDGNQDRKRPGWPVFGGTNFVMCYECFQLLQMPHNLHFFKERRNRMKCGHCFKLLMFTIVYETRIVPWHKVDKSSSQSSQVPSGGAGPSQSDRNTLNDGYGSITEYETDSSGGGRGKKKKKSAPDALHKLVGYFSARDVLHEK